MWILSPITSIAKEAQRLWHLAWRWTSLRRIANWRIVTTSYVWLLIVPACVKLLGPFAGPRDITLPWLFGADKTFHIDLALPFTWQVFFTMALVFFFGRVFFVWFCPEIIQRYRNFGEYRAANPGNRPILGLVRQIIDDGHMPTTTELARGSPDEETVSRNRLKEIEESTSPEAAKQTCIRFCRHDIIVGDGVRQTDSGVARAFDHIARVAAEARAKRRILTASFLYIGVALLLVVLAQNVWQVSEYWLTEAPSEEVCRVCHEWRHPCSGGGMPYRLGKRQGGSVVSFFDVEGLAADLGHDRVKLVTHR